jgi:hypothetical protein
LTGKPATGGAQDLTRQASWTSSNAKVATISPAGLVTAQGYGASVITATYQGVTTAMTFVVTIAGTWVTTAPNGSRITWVLAQDQGIVNGTFTIAPLPAGNGLSTATVMGTLGGTTLTWTMSGTIGSDSGQRQCVGVVLSLDGTAQIQPGGTSMNATVQDAMGVCDPSLAPSIPIGSTVTFSRS